MPKPVPLPPAFSKAADHAASRYHGPQRQQLAQGPKVEQIPLQVRLPREEVRAIKIAAAEAEQTISDFMFFMLSCLHGFNQTMIVNRQPTLPVSVNIDEITRLTGRWHVSTCA